jgi:hypothetical protein
MIEDYCPGCGHLLSDDKKCSFCNYSYSEEQLDNRVIEMFDWAREDYVIPYFIDD